MSKKKVDAEVKEEVKVEALEATEEVTEEKEAKTEEKVKAPKKTKAELNRELKAAIAEENTSRKDRTRAEKAARREIKASRKEAKIVEEKKKRLGNGMLALMIFGVIALMFVFVWGYNYFSKEASIESYIANNGGTESYSDMTMSETTTMSMTAKKNNVKIVLDITAEAGTEDAKYYKTDEGKEQMEYLAAYWMGSIKPLTRGSSAKADVVAKLNGKKINTVTVDWSQVDKILEKYGMSVDALQQQQAQVSNTAHTHTGQ